MKFYVCNHCGNIIRYEKDTGVPVMCCGEKMEELIKTLNSLKTELTPEMLEAIKKISVETSPEWKALKETVAEQVHDSIMIKTESELSPKEEEKPEDLKDTKIDFSE